MNYGSVISTLNSFKKNNLKNEKEHGTAMEKSDLNLNIVADEILQVHKLLHMDGCFYLYQGGVFRPLENADIKRIVKRKLGTFHSIRREEEVLNALSIESFKKCQKVHGLKIESAK